MKDIRAVRNNNPGNLDRGEAWTGLMRRSEMTPAQAAETRFAVFRSPQWGFRALALVLLNYERLHGLNTVGKIVHRFAPPAENNTDAYVQWVCNWIGRGPDVPLDLHDKFVLADLARAVAMHECGGWVFNLKDLILGVDMAEP